MPYIELDAIDLKILKALQNDGRLSNTELADAVNLSASPCLRRVRRLERDGFIRGYRAVIDREAVGLSITVFVEIRLDRPSHNAAEELQQALLEIPEVVSCHMLSGSADCLAEVVVPNVKAFDALLNAKLRAIPNIGELRSNIALRRVRSEAPIPLDHLRRPSLSRQVQAPDCD